MFLLYRKPVLVICALNLTALSLIALSWPAPVSSRVSAQPASCNVTRTGNTPSVVQLKVRAVKIFEAQRNVRSTSDAYLAALSEAVSASSWEKVGALLNEYDCGRTL